MPLTRSQAKKIKLSVDTDSLPLTSGAGTGDGSRSNEFQIMTNSIYKNLNVIGLLGKYGGRSELLHLREISKDYHKLINPIYLQHVNKIIRITTSHYIWREYIEILKNNWVGEGKGFRVTNENWTREIAYMFRRLNLSDIWRALNKPNLRVDGLDLNLILHHTGPFITTLDLRVITQPEDPNNWDLLSQFMKHFTNLKSLSINCINLENHQRFLDTILTVLTPGVSIRISHEFNSYNNDDQTYVQLLTKYGTTNPAETNLTIFHGIEKFESLIQNHGSFTNLKFHIHSNEIKNLVKLQNYTDLCLQYQDFIEELDINLWVDSGFRTQDKVAIKRCLAQLSPIVTKLDIYLSSYGPGRGSCWNFDLLNPSADTNWLKLSDLSISSGTPHSFEILKTTKRVQKLYLNIGQDSYMASETAKSRKECIKEYFGNLCELEHLKIDFRVRFLFELKKEIDEFVELLKEVLPKNASVEYRKF